MFLLSQKVPVLFCLFVHVYNFAMSTKCYVQWDLTLLKGSFYVINITFKWKFASLFIFDVVTSM